MPRRIASNLTPDQMHVAVTQIIAEESESMRNVDAYTYVRAVLKAFPFVGYMFAEDLAGWIETHEKKLEKINPDWENGSLFETVCYNPSKNDFTFSDKYVPMEDLLALCATFYVDSGHTLVVPPGRVIGGRGKGPLFFMESSDVKEVTGYTLRRIRSFVQVVSE
jgi:hypothetical protein